MPTEQEQPTVRGGEQPAAARAATSVRRSVGSPGERAGARRRRVAGGRPHPVTVKFTDQEYEVLLVRSAAAGLTPAAFLAAAADTTRAGLGPGGMPAEERRAWAGEIMAVRRQLGAVGNNVNQLARAANAGARIDATVAATTVRACQRAVTRADEVLGHLHGGRG